MPYVHIRPVTGNGDSSTQVAPRLSESTISDGRSPGVDAGLIRIGLFVPAQQGQFSSRNTCSRSATFLSPFRRAALQPCRPERGALSRGRLTDESGCRPDSENRCPRQVDGGFPPEAGRPRHSDRPGSRRRHHRHACHSSRLRCLPRMARAVEEAGCRPGLITASTEALNQRLTDYNDHVVTLLNALDSELWFAPLAPDQDGHSPRTDSDSFRLLYFGSRTHGGTCISLRNSFVVLAAQPL